MLLTEMINGPQNTAIALPSRDFKYQTPEADACLFRKDGIT